MKRQEKFEDILLECLFLMLRPIAGFCLRRSLKLQEILEVCKRALVRAAEEELLARGDQVSVSRITFMSGVHRKDVTRIMRSHAVPRENSDIAARVINEWRQNPTFQTKGGKPRVLTHEGQDSEFSELIATVSREFPSYPVIFELERSGAIEKTTRGLKLLHQIYAVPKGDLKQGYSMLGKDVADLMSCVDFNMQADCKYPNFHVSTEYDNIDEDSKEEVRDWIIREGSAFHRKVQRHLAKYDCDLNPKLKKKKGGTRVVLGSFSLIDDSDEEI